MSHQDEEEPGRSTVSTREQYEIDWAHTWEKERCTSFGWNWGPKFVNSGIPLCPLTSISIFFSFVFHIYVQDYRTHMRYLPPLFQGLHLLWKATSLCEEDSHLEVAGLQKVELVLAGSSAEGLHGLLWDVLSCTSSTVSLPPVRMYQWAATVTIAKPTPEEPESVDPEHLVSVSEGDTQAQEAPYLAIP